VALYLGLDASTQSLSAIAIEVDGSRRHVVAEEAVSYDEDLPRYGTRHGVLPHRDPAIAVSSPVLWAHALDLVLQRIVRSGVEVRRIAAISGSAQQHGSVYLNAASTGQLRSLDPARPLTASVGAMLSRSVAPIWMDSSTSVECAEIAAAVGGDATLAQRTGSRAFERFTGPQIRKFFKDEPDAYANTSRIHLVSSFMASLLSGRHAPLDSGDASGMNLMDLATRTWWQPALDATAPDLAVRLPSIVPSWTVVGELSPYWQAAHGLPAAKVIAWSGDNPCSLVGTGLVREGRVAISLGTSDTIFGLMAAPRVDATGTGHVFGSPTGDYMGLTCFKNGSLARERVRDELGMTWAQFSSALASTPPGNDGRVLLPWFEPEITPDVAVPGVHRFGLSPDDGPANVRAVVEAQQMALALHSRWMGVRIDTIFATGGAAANVEILQVMADVFGAEVHQLEIANSAALGAALRAFHADALSEGREIPWDEVIAGLVQPTRRIDPDPARHAIYRTLIDVYASREAEALRAIRGSTGTPPKSAAERLPS
jgi:xylulokinase